MRALLDVNVLIALLDAGHVHHCTATNWLDQEIHHGWASCPLTQNGCIRIMAQPGYPAEFTASEIANRLAEATADAAHAFWPVDVSLLEPGQLDWSRVLGHRQVTDLYLLHLAVKNEGRFVTFDRSIPITAIPGATPSHLAILKG